MQMLSKLHAINIKSNIMVLEKSPSTHVLDFRHMGPGVLTHPALHCGASSAKNPPQVPEWWNW